MLCLAALVTGLITCEGMSRVYCLRTPLKLESVAGLSVRAGVSSDMGEVMDEVVR